ncbi:MAG: UDP-N-acetylmuramate--L-alanine ligase [Egibacteraceae bacterium]
MAGVAPPLDLRRPYFVGIGGIGMSAVAKICAVRGCRVAGSDVTDSGVLEALRRLGCEVHVGHAAERVTDASCVVVSQAIPESNPELRAARVRGIPVAHRAQALAVLMDGYRSVAVAGTHGKSSTTAMLVAAFQGLGLDPSYAIGADLDEPTSNAHHGSGDIFVAEADESDRSFHYYRPLAATVLNVEEDHHDHYTCADEHLSAYETFAHRIQPGGTLVASADDPGSRQLCDRLASSAPGLRVVTYGESDSAEVRIVKIETHGFVSTAAVRISEVGEIAVWVGVPGRHMAHNAVGALAVGMALGADPRRMAEALGRYQGVRRRFTVKGEAGGVTVVDSYAHHPTEITADLETARAVLDGRGRVVVVFQPHRFSRTRALGAEAGRVLASADLVVLMEVYASHEEPIPGVTSQIVAQAVLEHGGVVRTEPCWTAVPDVVASLAQRGDLVLTMGAGDVTLLGPKIVERIAARPCATEH